MPASGASSTRLGISWGPRRQLSLSEATDSKVPSAAVSRVRIAHPTTDDQPDFLALTTGNREFHHPWAHPPQDPAGFEDLLARDARDDTEVFLARLVSGDALVGVLVLSQIFRAGFQSAYLGY